MKAIEIKDLATAGKERELTPEEMKCIKGGTDVSGPFGAWGLIDAILAPISFDQMEQYLKEKAKAGKS